MNHKSSKSPPSRQVQTWLLPFILSAIMIGFSNLTARGCPPCYVANPDYDSDNPYETDPPCIPSPPDCSTSRGKLYDFTITTRRIVKTPKPPWRFISSESMDYNDLIGYIYACNWERLVKIKEYRIRTRYYAYSWQTICVCPYSYNSGLDSGKERSETLITDYDEIEKRQTSVASSIFRSPGTGNSLCRISGQPGN